MYPVRLITVNENVLTNVSFISHKLLYTFKEVRKYLVTNMYSKSSETYYRSLKRSLEMMVSKKLLGSD